MSAENRKAVYRSPVNGYEVWRWPETVAFLMRLGIPIDDLTKRVTIVLDENIVRVIHQFLAEDTSKATNA